MAVAAFVPMIMSVGSAIAAAAPGITALTGVASLFMRGANPTPSLPAPPSALALPEALDNVTDTDTEAEKIRQLKRARVARSTAGITRISGEDEPSLASKTLLGG